MKSRHSLLTLNFNFENVLLIHFNFLEKQSIKLQESKFRFIFSVKLAVSSIHLFLCICIKELNRFKLFSKLVITNLRISNSLKCIQGMNLEPLSIKEIKLVRKG